MTTTSVCGWGPKPTMVLHSSFTLNWAKDHSDVKYRGMGTRLCEPSATFSKHVRDVTPETLPPMTSRGMTVVWILPNQAIDTSLVKLRDGHQALQTTATFTD